MTYIYCVYERPSVIDQIIITIIIIISIIIIIINIIIIIIIIYRSSSCNNCCINTAATVITTFILEISSGHHCIQLPTYGYTMLQFQFNVEIPMRTISPFGTIAGGASLESFYYRFLLEEKQISCLASSFLSARM